jgi:hypothetical protein
MLQITPQIKILVAIQPADSAAASMAWRGCAEKRSSTIPSPAPSLSSAIAVARR